MAERFGAPDGIKPRARAALTGVLATQPVPREIRTTGREVCRTTVQVGDQDIPVMAEGGMAKKLSAVQAGSVVRLAGDLVRYVWQTTAREKRERLEVSIDSLEVLRRV